jgi:aminoglycoside phosphotransferase family enzyme/predicted kinase
MAATDVNIYPGLPPLINALLASEAYSDPVQRVELVETHASWLLLAGAFAYKIKKPVKLPFLDYSTLEKRHFFCEAELRLNRRFAPQIYLSVEAIVGSLAKPQIGGNRLDRPGDQHSDRGRPIEFAVKMRRFAEAGRLDRVCMRGELQATHLADLADAVTSFHAAAAVAPMDSRFGSPELVQMVALENFEELQTLLPDAADQARLEPLIAWTQASFERLAPIFATRKAAGKIRECHGDLHLGNMVLIDGRVTLFDCVEFNEDFRWIDVASEIAFTYIDLLDHGQPGLAAWFVNEWLSRSGDYDAVKLLRFYAVYRALVRAKVAAIRATQAHSNGDNDNDSGFGAARDYLDLAESLIALPQLRLLITHGLSGSGKTRASSRLLLGDTNGTMLRVRSDVERKRLFGLAATANSVSALDDGIYGPAATELTYRRLQTLAEDCLAASWSVVVDAAFLNRTERRLFRAMANKAGATFSILAPHATTEQLRARIIARLAKHHDASEATPQVLEMQMQEIEALDAFERQSLLEDSKPDRSVASVDLV